MSSQHPVLSCRQLKKHFSVMGKRIDVLKGVDLDVFPGELIVIHGRSGEGKSVLQWILSGIDTPSSGEIMIDGIPYHKLSDKELAGIRREKIGLVFQNFNLIPSWTALENVEAALLNSPVSENGKKEKAMEMLERMNLKDRLDNLPVELSVGQQQRVALARALINKPSLIIADEPTGNVDDETSLEMLQILLSYVKDTRSAMIVTTHGHFTGMKHADRVFRLSEGVLIPN